MNICECDNRNSVQNIIVRDLRVLGIKHRQKKFTNKPDKGFAKRVFKVPLQSLPADCVALSNGYHIKIPRFVHEACSFIRLHLDTEGLFRKAGSSIRQKEMKLQLDKKGKLDKNYNVIDVANVFKLFFRELPEPLIPYSYHDTFLHCLRLDKSKSVQFILNVCLLLPFENICTLMYVMEFLQIVANNSNTNKMDVCNLSIILTPNVMPLDPQMKMENHSNQRLSYHVKVVRILIEQASNIGIIPIDIVDKLSLMSTTTANSQDNLNTLNDVEEKKKKKKRRSGSLTRMFNGLKKIVSGKVATDDDTIPRIASSPDLRSSTPVLAPKSGNKRKAMDTSGLSTKKKRDIVQSLPKKMLLTDTPKRDLKIDTPLESRRRRTLSKWFTTSTPIAQPSSQCHDTRRSYLTLNRNRSKSKCDSFCDPEESVTALKRLERRWSLISNATTWVKKRKQLTEDIPMVLSPEPLTKPDFPMCETPDFEELKPIDNTTIDSRNDEIEFVRIPKQEYEEIKNRVSAIENQITEEFEKDGSTFNKVDEVQCKYEQTLEESEPLQMDTSTDKLAKRLSRELKIRRSDHRKVIRSPSARKIGTIRRRSKEFEKKQIKADLSRSALKRGRPNTLLTGLKHPSPTKLINDVPLVSTLGTPRSDKSADSVLWCSAERFFAPENISKEISRNESKENSIASRASLAKIRTQNAGMVLAKAKLFDGLMDSPRNTRNRRQSKVTSRHNNNASIPTPRRKQKSPKPKFNNKENKSEFESPKSTRHHKKCFETPKNSTPQIKKALVTKTPKHLKIPNTHLTESRGRTPFKATPLKAVHSIQPSFGQTPQRHSPRLVIKSRHLSSAL